MISSSIAIDAPESRRHGGDAATVHTLPPRESAGEASWVAVVDSRPSRREFIAKFLAGQDYLSGRIVSLDLEDLLRDRPAPFSEPSLIVYSVGGTSLADPKIGADFEQLLERFAEAPVVVLSDFDSDDEAQLAICAGAHGFVPTMLEPQLMCAALALVQSGGKFAPPDQLDRWAHATHPIHPQPATEPAADDPLPHYEGLSPRQTHVLLLLREGLANKVIASRLGMTESTVKVHVRQIMRRLGARNRTEAALFAQRHQEALKGRAR